MQGLRKLVVEHWHGAESLGGKGKDEGFTGKLQK